ncbi:cytochrome P450 [Halopelagius fulvigenes]|uniref:Cytochrome P450 n=1 Tax=Halopelagius fulvigenes TaxID=1198324 RepID=A0ABD5TXT9_9EURY
MSHDTSKRSPSNSPPEPPTLPLVGHTHQFLRRNPLKWFTELNEEYESTVQLRIAGQRLILPTRPSDIERVLVSNNENYRKGGFQKRVTRSLLGDGLVLAEGEEWRTNRRAIEPAFYSQQIEKYRDVVRFHARSVADEFSDGDVIDLEVEMKRLTLNIIVEVLFGVDLSTESWELKPAFERILAHFERISRTYIYLPEWIPTPENLAYRRALNTLDTAVEELVEQHRARGKESLAVLGRLQNSELTQNERPVRDEVVTLLVAGHETTALALTFTGYLLATHQETQATLAKEVRELPVRTLLQRRGEYSVLDKVLKESLRLFPPVFGIFRQPTTDDSLSGYRVPAGSLVALNQWVVHRDPRWFDAPTEFHPERWSIEFERELSPGAYFPFAGGPRRCVGERFALMEVKIVLSELLKRFELRPELRQPLEVVPSLTTQPATEIRISVHDRAE